MISRIVLNEIVIVVSIGICPTNIHSQVASQEILGVGKGGCRSMRECDVTDTSAAMSIDHEQHTVVIGCVDTAE